MKLFSALQLLYHRRPTVYFCPYHLARAYTLYGYYGGVLRNYLDLAPRDLRTTCRSTMHQQVRLSKPIKGLQGDATCLDT